MVDVQLVGRGHKWASNVACLRGPCLRRRHYSSSVCSHGSTGAAACRGALVCGQRAGIHGFLTCHPPTLQVDEEVGAARAFAHCSFHGRRGGVWVLVSGSAVSTALPSAPLLGTFVPQFGAPARILPRTLAHTHSCRCRSPGEERLYTVPSCPFSVPLRCSSSFVELVSRASY